MVPRRSRTRTSKSVESITHEEAKRRNLPSAEHQPRLSETIGQSGMLEEWDVPQRPAGRLARGRESDSHSLLGGPYRAAGGD